MVHIVLDYQRGDLDKALSDVQALIAEGHAMPEAYNTLGELFTHSTRHQDLGRARAALLQALDEAMRAYGKTVWFDDTP